MCVFVHGWVYACDKLTIIVTVKCIAMFSVYFALNQRFLE